MLIGLSNGQKTKKKKKKQNLMHDHKSMEI